MQLKKLSFRSRAGIEDSKKWGMLFLVNQLFKIYFKVPFRGGACSAPSPRHRRPRCGRRWRSPHRTRGQVRGAPAGHRDCGRCPVCVRFRPPPREVRAARPGRAGRRCPERRARRGGRGFHRSGAPPGLFPAAAVIAEGQGPPGWARRPFLPHEVSQRPLWAGRPAWVSATGLVFQFFF